ncbi:MAG: HD domain-containing protein [Deltaproteobacteria bacterium]|nr:HD domain-containing protein [Deltaproteobacteria bacterium]
MDNNISTFDTVFLEDDTLIKTGATPELIESMHKEGYLQKLRTAKGLSYRVEKDIYARITDADGKEKRGSKIISKGGVIDSGTFSDIIKRRLWERIDKCMTIDGKINHEAIISSIERLKEESPIHSIIFETGKAELIENIIKQIDFDKIMLENLNILYEQEHEGRYVQHAQNTAIFAIKIGTGYGLNKNTLVDLAKAGYLHDIGKIAIDPDIWKKQENELTDQEKRQIKAHPLIGEYILEGATFILKKKYDVKIIRGVGDHHERPTSEGGFPRGIRGDKIGDFARIITIASKFDNMLRASIKGPRESEKDHHEINMITDTLDWLTKMAGQGWYDPIYVDILTAFYTPAMAMVIGERVSKDEIKAIQNIFIGIEKAAGFMMNLHFDEVKSSHPKVTDYCNRICSNAFQISRVIREAGITEPLLLTYSQENNAATDVKESLKKTVSCMDTPLKQMREYIDEFELFAESRSNSCDSIIDSVTTWYDVIDKTLRNTAIH